MTRKYDDQELFDLFHENLPPVEVPPMLAAKIRQSVMAEVADLSEVSQEGVGLDAISPVASTKASGRRLVGSQPAESGLRQFFEQIGRSLRWAPSLAVAGATVAVVLFFFYLIPSLYPQNSEIGPSTGSTVTTELAPVTVSLETAVATISDGNATLVSDTAGGTQSLSAGAQVEMLAGDELITLDGRATIEYFPGQVTSVEPGTHVVLTELAEENNGTQVAVNIRVGTVRNRLDPLTETSDRFEVHTPGSMARAVGTDFTVSVASDIETDYAVHEGVIEVEMDGQRITVMAGNRLDAVAGQPLVTSPMDPEPADEPDAVAIAQEPTAVPTYTEAPTATETPLPTDTPLPTETPTSESTATSLPTETLTPEPTATPLPTETSTTEPSATPLPSATATSTATETAVPTSTPTSTATVTSTSTSTRPPTSTPTVTPVPITVDLVSPNHKVGGDGDTTFRWRANAIPPEGQAFELIFWREGDDPMVDGFGLGRPTRNTSLTVDLNYLDNELRDLLDPGEYHWGVLLVNEAPYERLRLFTDSRLFRYHGPDSNGSAPSPG